jgi:hypothetical protein
MNIHQKIKNETEEFCWLLVTDLTTRRTLHDIMINVMSPLFTNEWEESVSIFIEQDLETKIQ